MSGTPGQFEASSAYELVVESLEWGRQVEYRRGGSVWRVGCGVGEESAMVDAVVAMIGRGGFDWTDAARVIRAFAQESLGNPETSSRQGARRVERGPAAADR
jgi:hypothetical protein